MARDKIDEVPMLLESQSQRSQDSSLPEVELQSFPMGRSMSISLPMREGLRSHENERRDVPFSGPLRNDERRRALIPMSGPLQSNRRVNIARVSVSGPLRIDREVEERVVNSHVSVSGGGGDHGVNNNYGGKHEHLLKSGLLGRCNDPFCTTCPSYYDFSEIHTRNRQLRPEFEYPGTFFGDVNHSIKNFLSQPWAYGPGIMSPHAKIVQQWNKFFVISCLVAIFVDPLFFFLLSVKQENRCIFFNKTLALVITVVRSTTDFVYFLHMLLQFRLAYIAPESRVVGAGDLVDDPREIAHHYMSGYFLLDLFVVLPLPQIIIWVFLPKNGARSTANYAKNLLRITVLLQYIPRMIRFLPLLAGRSATGFIFESAWANFVINLLIFILAGHVVGSCWYLFGLQRVNQCLRDACINATITMQKDFLNFIDCGDGTKSYENHPNWTSWLTNSNSTDCLQGADSSVFTYGIYSTAVPLTITKSVITKYIYSLFWGFQQISTLAGNQVPSLFVWEVVFTMGIIGLGLLLFALLIGNMQNFLQSLGRRRLEMQLRQRDVELWMDRRRLPVSVRRRVRQSERFKWAANRGVNEEQLLEDLPEDLQREIRGHLCLDLVKKVRIFTVMDDQVLDAICERLRQRLYIGGSEILRIGYPIDKMIFIVRGNLESTGKDGSVNLSGGDICGEELLMWCLEHTPLQNNSKKFRRTGQRAISSRTVRCAGSVEAFCLQAADLEEVTRLFSRPLRNPRVQGAIRYESPYWRTWAASCIQVAWKYRKKRLQRSATTE